MKILASTLMFFFLNTINSQVVQEDWKMFELTSKWKLNYIENDSVKENHPYIGQLVFLNKNPDEPEFSVVFRVYKSEEELNASLGNSKILKSILLEKTPNVLDKFEFKKNFYLLTLTEELMFREKYYNSLVTEIEKFIKM